MELKSDVDGVWQEQVKALPVSFLGAMRSDFDAGALTLSIAHVQSLDNYAEYVRRLPTSPAQFVNWLAAPGASVDIVALQVFFASVSDAELNPNSLLSFFRQLKEHAKHWDVLFAKNLQLTIALASAAAEIAWTGSDILKACELTKALGKRREAWDTLLTGEPLALGPFDRRIISSLPWHIDTLKNRVVDYSRQVELVCIEVTQFRDEARNTLIPAAANKVTAIEKHQTHTPKDLSARTMALVSMQLRIRELTSRLQSVETLLRTVLSASSHLHSAWQSISAYIDASGTKLQQIQTGQQLARFAIYFGQFQGQWKAIYQSAMEMNHRLSSLKR